MNSSNITCTAQAHFGLLKPHAQNFELSWKKEHLKKNKGKEKKEEGTSLDYLNVTYRTKSSFSQTIKIGWHLSLYCNPVFLFKTLLIIQYYSNLKALLPTAQYSKQWTYLLWRMQLIRVYRPELVQPSKRVAAAHLV